MALDAQLADLLAAVHDDNRENATVEAALAAALNEDDKTKAWVALYVRDDWEEVRPEYLVPGSQPLPIPIRIWRCPEKNDFVVVQEDVGQHVPSHCPTCGSVLTMEEN
jgi:hypothetical protein